MNLVQPDDGLTIDIPLQILSLVKKERVDWLVPGRARDKCIGLIKSLSKEKRKNFIPVSETIERVLKDFHFVGKTLEESLARDIHDLWDCYSIEDFQSHFLDQHLVTNLRILSNDGKTLGVGQDVDALKDRFLSPESLGKDKTRKHKH